MEILKGIGVSPGVAISTALVLDADDLVIAHRKLDPSAAAGELERLRAAIDAAIADLAELRDATTEAAGKEIGAIFGLSHRPAARQDAGQSDRRRDQRQQRDGRVRPRRPRCGGWRRRSGG